MENLFDNYSSTIAKDLKLNLGRLLAESSLSPEQAHLTLLATATAVGHKSLAQAAVTKLKELGLAPDAIREGAEVAAILGMLNAYYRFKHMVAKDDIYRETKLRMTSLARPSTGKATFELLALAVSVLGGCEVCIKAHEKVVVEALGSTDIVHDAARLAAVVKGLSVLDQHAIQELLI